MRLVQYRFAFALALTGCLLFTGGQDANADITSKPMTYSTEPRPLSEAVEQIQKHLGAQISLKGIASSNITVEGQFSGNNGYEFLANLAKKLRLEWAATDKEAFLAPAGSKSSEQFPVGNSELASTVATKLKEQFKNRGSNISVTANGNMVAIAGPMEWLNAVKGDLITRTISDARKDLIQTLTDSKSPAPSPMASSGDVSISSGEPGGLNMMIFKLKNAWAEDKTANVGGAQQNIPGVASMFSQLTGIPKLSKPPTESEPNKKDPSGTATSLPPLPAVAGGIGNAPISAVVNNTSKDQPAPQGKKHDALPNQRSVIADPRQNAVIVRDSQEHFEEYKRLINYMDQAAPMIQIDAYIVDLQKNEATNLGFGLSWSGGALGGVGGSTVNPGGALASPPNVILSQAQGIQLLAQISALETRGLSQVVSVPTVLAINNLEAVFSTRQTFYVPVQGNQDASLTSVTASTFLRVTPMFADEDKQSDVKRIKMLLNIQDSAVDNASTSQVSGLPQVTENQIATQAIINNGDTLVIGGQVVRKVIDSDAGLPYLNRLPIIGILFGQRSRQYQEFLRVYIISPRMLGEDSAQAAAASVGQPKGVISNNKMLRQDLPKVMQGTSLPTNPDLKLEPNEKEQNNQNSIFVPIPSI